MRGSKFFFILWSFYVGAMTFSVQCPEVLKLSFHCKFEVIYNFGGDFSLCNSLSVIVTQCISLYTCTTQSHWPHKDLFLESLCVSCILFIVYEYMLNRSMNYYTMIESADV